MVLRHVQPGVFVEGHGGQTKRREFAFELGLLCGGRLHASPARPGDSSHHGPPLLPPASGARRAGATPGASHSPPAAVLSAPRTEWASWLDERAAPPPAGRSRAEGRATS